MAQLSVTFLGTGGSWPTSQRGLSAIAVKRGGEVLLFDCGEGTQRQLQRSELSYQQITRIFLTHYHGDHCFGVPGLVKTMALNERDRPLHLYGPRGLARMVDAWRKMGGWTKQFPIQVTELAPGDEVEGDGYTVEVHRADHSVENLTYAIQEPDRPGRFNKPRALELGIPEGRMFGQLQRGQSVQLDDGRTITPDMVLGEARQGRRVAYSGDTQPCEGLASAAAGADLFICEATFTQDLVERAREVKHMTAAEAAAIATHAGAKRLMLTHISPRYQDATPVLEEAQAVFPTAELAEDLLTTEVAFP
ncbi:MAG: ribonuclease Z [Thermoplasmatota archaeon]